MLTVLLFVGVCFLAYANGANDNFKGVDSLFGSGKAHTDVIASIALSCY